MTKSMKKATGESLATDPVAENTSISSRCIIANEALTCKGGTASLKMGGINYRVLHEFKTFLGTKELFFNATEITKQYNLKSSLGDNSHHKKKRVVDWLKNSDTQELIESLQSLYALKSVKRLVEKRGSGRYKSTWLHRELWLHFMYWLDVNHKIAIMQFVEMMMHTYSNIGQRRIEASETTKSANDAIYELQEAIKAKFPTSARATQTINHIQSSINKIVTGVYGATDRNELSAGQLQEIKRLERTVQDMILERIPYQCPKTTAKEVLHYLKGLEEWSA